MLTVLSKVQKLQIRASHDVNIATSYLYGIKMDAAVKNGDDLIFGLEDCLCPLEYAGPSCQECGPGHTRQKDGSCKKCETRKFIKKLSALGNKMKGFCFIKKWFSR